jgi:transcriptional regulator with XRE-family HTH domain
MKQPELGGFIANLRKEQGLTQEELVDLCNINVRTIQRIESGDVTPRNYTIKNILTALGSSFEEITQELDQKSETEKAPESLLKNPNNGLWVAIVGMAYILTSIPLMIIDLSLNFWNHAMVSSDYRFLIAMHYCILAILFYTGFAFNVKMKSPLLKLFAILYIMVLLFSEILFMDMYNTSVTSFKINDYLGMSILISLLFAISISLLAIPFFKLQKQLQSPYRYWGYILLIAGFFNLTVVLFPLGSLLVTAVEVMIVIYFIQNHKAFVKELETI